MTRAVLKPSLIDALIPVVLLISMLAGTVYVFGLDSFGPNLVALIISAAVYRCSDYWVFDRQESLRIPAAFYASFGDERCKLVGRARVGTRGVCQILVCLSAAMVSRTATVMSSASNTSETVTTR